MKKFFVTDEPSCELCFQDAPGSWDSTCGPFMGGEAVCHPSFLNLENAKVFSRKIRERRESRDMKGVSPEHDEVMVTNHDSYIYAVDIPSNWSGEDVALWLQGAIGKGEIRPI